jgi:tRNA A37 threonylcarbamoyladenosine dehydratase
MATMTASSSRTAAATGFIVGSIVTLASAWIVQKMQLSFWNKNKDSSSPSTPHPHPHHHQINSNGSNGNEKNHIPKELRDEQLSRHNLYFGDAGMDRLRQAKICVVGVGGVGSHTAHMLARAGVGYIRLIDFDQVTLSSLNRHAVAVLADVGISKVECLANYLRKICPDPAYLQLDPVVEMYTAESGPRLLQLPHANEKWDLVIDAIDDVPTKAALVAQCLQAGTRVLSCMGAGGKSDPTRVHISDLKTASRDPLATKLRQSLKKLLSDSPSANGADNKSRRKSDDNDKNKNNHESNKAKSIQGKYKKTNAKNSDEDKEYLENMQQLTVVYSSETTVVKLADLSEEQQDAGDHVQYGAVDNMRVRVLPVLGTMPAVMGQALAAVALTDLGGKPFQAVPMERVSRNVRNKVHQKLMRREELLTRKQFKLTNKKEGDEGDGDEDDAPDESKPKSQSTMLWEELNARGGLVGGVWVGPLAIDQEDIDYLLDIWRNRCAITGSRLGTVLSLNRWDDQRPGTCDNLVLMSQHALLAFDKEGGKENIPLKVRQKIEERLASCKPLV